MIASDDADDENDMHSAVMYAITADTFNCIRKVEYANLRSGGKRRNTGQHPDRKCAFSPAFSQKCRSAPIV